MPNGSRPSEDVSKKNKQFEQEAPIMDDVLTSSASSRSRQFSHDPSALADRLWHNNRNIYQLLLKASDLEAARDALYAYLDRVSRATQELDCSFHSLEKANLEECVRALRNIIGPAHEARTGVSALEYLWKMAQGEAYELEEEISPGFVMEFIHLFRGAAGRSGLYPESEDDDVDGAQAPDQRGRRAAKERTRTLDAMMAEAQERLAEYPSGLDERVVRRREKNRDRILRFLGGSAEDWDDPAWQIKNIISDAGPLLSLIELEPEERKAVRKAARSGMPFGITPYYLSLMDRRAELGYDHAIRAQVIPPPSYVNSMLKHETDREAVFDFMGEQDTSPIDLVTRRYPGIAILKPFNTCAQICVYCQRNWEIDDVMDPRAKASLEKLERALAWFDDHPGVVEVLVTGGDPCVMKNSSLRYILQGLSEKEHIRRIRLGTRTPVVMPMRWTEDLAELLGEFHEPPKREIALVTHFMHSYEITPEAMQAVQRVKRQGIGVYNQQVFTMDNSRRFETAKLRRDLRAIGVDPYYTFNMKGKEETDDYRVPIARLLQERKEEARLFPGLERTDEAVFNVPRLGKNQLNAWQGHRLIMIRPDGRRVYEFHPWEKNITAVPTYDYTDVSIYDYLVRVAERGEDVRDYKTIWYYL